MAFADVDDLDATRETLLAAGATERDAPRQVAPEARVCVLADPDGNPIGLRGIFTQRYGVKMLVWYKSYESRESAFMRERRLKKWNRAWKLALIEQQYPSWRDLWTELSAPP